MRLFISYARVDRPYCKQIVELLDIHETWYDYRTHVGQAWWDEILRRLDWCEGLIYLVSPESLASDYCQREVNIALNLGKPVFPVRIHADAKLPDALKQVQVTDLSNGLDAKAVRELLATIVMAERQTRSHRALTTDRMPAAVKEVPTHGSLSLIEEAAAAMNAENFDRAVFLLKRARSVGITSKFIDLARMLKEAENALEHQTYVREAEREYAPILALVQRESTRRIGCQAFKAFQKAYPDYDPEGLAALCEEKPHRPTVMMPRSLEMPLLEWCRVPGGKVTVEYERDRKTYDVPAFQMSKYPVTIAQFQAFVDAEDGYHDDRWWGISLESCEWHVDNPRAMRAPLEEHSHPRANVCWYEAVAFCHWLSYKTGLRIGLPTEQQWQRAAQGDDGRLYPWGNKYSKSLCNTREAGLRRTSEVTLYPQSVSPYGVADLIGNVWEWCANGQPASMWDGPQTDPNLKAVRGGSCISSKERANNRFRFYLNPLCRYASIGFRIACEVS